MGHLFISYRRKDWPFTRELVERLDKLLADEIFIDVNIDEPNFQKSFLRNNTKK